MIGLLRKAEKGNQPIKTLKKFLIQINRRLSILSQVFPKKHLERVQENFDFKMNIHKMEKLNFSEIIR